jgi:hypothetical protein
VVLVGLSFHLDSAFSHDERFGPSGHLIDDHVYL